MARFGETVEVAQTAAWFVERAGSLAAKRDKV